MPKGTKSIHRDLPFKNGRGTISLSYNSAKQDEPATILIYEDIGEDPWFGGGISAGDIADILAETPRNKALDVRVNSAGGVVWDGLAIKTMLDEWPEKVTVSIDGMAASTASWAFLGADEVRAPAHAQMFVHDAWGFTMGNAEDLEAEADKLEKTSVQIAEMYSRKTGMTVGECRDLMRADGTGTLMTGQEAKDYGFIDRITSDDTEVKNFSPQQVNAMRQKLVALNAIRTGSPQQTTIVNRQAKIDLLKSWGYSGPITNKVTDAWLDKALERGRPKAVAGRNELYKFGEEGSGDEPADDDVKYKPGQSVPDGEHADDCNCDSCAGRTVNDDATSDPDGGGEFGNPAEKNRLRIAERRLNAALDRAEEREQRARERELDSKKTLVTNRLTKAAEDSKIPAGQLDAWIEDALNARDTGKFLDRIDALPAKRPGLEPLNLTVGETSSVDELSKMVNKLKEPQEYVRRNNLRWDKMTSIAIGNASKELSANLNRLKKYKMENGISVLDGPLRAMWDAWASSSPLNVNVMAPTLLRQVIMSETMRAFRRRLVPLEMFAHNFQTVPLEGTDLVVVPYYPLNTTASLQFSYAAGYNVFGTIPGGSGQTLSKQILVGGAAGVTNAGNAAGFAGTSIPGAGTPQGGGRLYQPLQFTAYEVRRQPWLDIQKLTIMAGEQLALDVLNTIIQAWINAANFGNAVFSGAAQLFDDTSIAALQVAANQSDWPEPMRGIVIDSVYYGNLIQQPYLKAFLNIGSTDPIREAQIGGVYGFERIVQNPRIPQGGDAQLKGWMCWPSAILVATAPIQPAPGEAQRMVSWDIIADDQTGLAFIYKYWGDPNFSADAEIVECTFGSNLGELAALKRIVAAGL